MIPTTHPDIKIDIWFTLEILGVNTTLSTLWKVFGVCTPLRVMTNIHAANADLKASADPGDARNDPQSGLRPQATLY